VGWRTPERVLSTVSTVSTVSTCRLSAPHAGDSMSTVHAL